MEIISGWYWKKGEKKKKNEDSILICQMIAKRKHCLIAGVCDGISSMKDGEIASGYVTEELVNWFYRDLVKAIVKNTRRSTLLNMGQRKLWKIHKELKSFFPGEAIATTLSLLLVIQNKFYLWNAGDSRIYMKRVNKPLQCITVDDFYRGDVTKAIGNHSFRGVNCSSGSLSKSTRFLIVSDGFYNKQSSAAMEALMSPQYIRNQQQIEAALQEAGMAVCRKGEGDDISAICIQINCKERESYVYKRKV